MDQGRRAIRESHAAINGATADRDAVASPAASREAHRMTPMPARHDWPAALDLVRQAATMVRDGRNRMLEIETQAREMARRVRDEIRAAEARAQSAEARAQAAEARAREAEEWLKRLTDALREEFAPEGTRH